MSFPHFPLWEVPGFKRGPGRPRINWRDIVNKDIQQGAYKSGKPGKLREFCKSGKLREFEMYSGNFCSPLLSATKM